ncbi:MAG: hypothetical protein F4X81_08135 [Gammaproteobacteria bacterium]|nr:hypothetical protein [Gammaproteobacteria bacterium]MYE51424.1 hypothetical protein [Gammaproteobacteria bacterium]
MVEYFFEDSWWVSGLRSSGWMFFAAGLFIGVFRALRPIGARISSTDIRVQIQIGNIFWKRFRGAIIIGSNATFDTSIEHGEISERSVQGQFTSHHFGSAVSELDLKIRTALAGTKPQRRHSDATKPFGKKLEFQLGTVAKVKADKRTGYLVAISRLNANKVAESDLNEYQDALSMMWEEIRRRGTQEDIVCPVLGTGLSRLPLSRMEAIRVIVRSFVAAASQGKLAGALTIVVHPRDLKNLDVKELREFLNCECTHRPSGPINSNAGPVGTAA